MNIIKLNDHWLFTKENNQAFVYSAISGGEIVTLPHCWNAADGQTGEMEYYRGKCWYQRKLDLSEEDMTRYIFLEIGAAGLVSEVYINGQPAGGSRCGFSMYRVPMNGLLKAGENLISVMVDNSHHDDVYPLMADFTFYGGLYREVRLIAVGPLHFDLLDNGRDGIYLTQKWIDSKSCELNVRGTIVNETAGETEVKVNLALIDREGRGVFNKTLDLSAEGKREFNLTEIIRDANLWQGTENPYLYTLQAELYGNGIVYDTTRSIEIGFRRIEVTADQGIFLNGKPIKINGVCRHQDFEGVGNAITKEHMDLDMELIKEMGANSIRLAHYQHDDYFYTLCDRAGMLVWAEIPFISIPTTTDTSNQNARDQLEKLVRQAYNHCSIYCWGVQNEITIAVENQRIRDMVKELAYLVRELDTSRLTAQANVFSVADESPLNELTDIVGYNLYYGWYYEEMQGLQKRLDEFHKARPGIPVLVSEYGVDTNPRIHTYDPSVRDYSEEYQLLFDENAIRTFDERLFVLGGYHWNMFDFGSAMRKEGGECGKNQKGLVTINRRLKKDAYYLYKAYWSKAPFVYLAGRRFVNRHQVLNDIVVLTNMEEVRLFLGNELTGELSSSEPVKRFSNVRLSPGENHLRAVGCDQWGNCCQDEMVLNHVNDIDTSYIIEKHEEQKHVTNWFEKFDLSAIQEVSLRDGYYSTFDSIKDLFENEEAKAVFRKYFGEMAEQPRFKPMIGLMTIDSMSKIVQFGIPKELLVVINQDLNSIPKKGFH